ncbi:MULTISPECIES: ParA family protein [Pseudomonas]|uniref:ParA family protein n=1 Tax=Pseudomonas TaxID=286 RepID=UPI0008E8D186|nr:MULTISPECIES: ParA family protein [Pseudomonas]SFT82232.1 chromosome partitioning protein [Pseudomonas marincola]
MIIVIGSNKGGVGKTTLATNLAVAFAIRMNKVMLVDADPQGSALYWGSIRQQKQHTPLVHVVPRRGNLVDALKVLSSQNQVVIVDVPGRNSPELISAMSVADVVISPHACTQLDLETLQECEDQVRALRQLNPELKVLIYQSMGTTNPAIRQRERSDFCSYVSAFENLLLANSSGFQRLAYRECISEGIGVLESRNPLAADEIQQLLSEILNG